MNHPMTIVRPVEKNFNSIDQLRLWLARLKIFLRSDTYIYRNTTKNEDIRNPHEDLL